MKHRIWDEVTIDDLMPSYRHEIKRLADKKITAKTALEILDESYNNLKFNIIRECGWELKPKDRNERNMFMDFLIGQVLMKEFGHETWETLLSGHGTRFSILRTA